MTNKDASGRITAVGNSLQTLQITSTYGNVSALSRCMRLLREVAKGLLEQPATEDAE